MKHQALPIGKNRMSSQVHNATVMVNSLAPRLSFSDVQQKAAPGVCAELHELLYTVVIISIGIFHIGYSLIIKSKDSGKPRSIQKKWQFKGDLDLLCQIQQFITNQKKNTLKRNSVYAQFLFKMSPIKYQHDVFHK